MLRKLNDLVNNVHPCIVVIIAVIAIIILIVTTPQVTDQVAQAQVLIQEVVAQAHPVVVTKL